MKALKLIFTISIAIFSFSAVSAQDGEQLFKSNCASCHKLGGKLVGPDLIGVNDRHNQEWLLKWVKSSQTMVKAGDPDAVKLFNDNNKIPMTDAFINEDEIKAVLGYIKTKGDEMAKGGGGGQNISTASSAASVATPAVTEPSVNLLNMFSFTEYLLLGLLFLFLIIIWMLARSIKTLSAQVTEKYNGQR